MFQATVHQMCHWTSLQYSCFTFPTIHWTSGFIVCLDIWTSIKECIEKWRFQCVSCQDNDSKRPALNLSLFGTSVKQATESRHQWCCGFTCPPEVWSAMIPSSRHVLEGEVTYASEKVSCLPALLLITTCETKTKGPQKIQEQGEKGKQLSGRQAHCPPFADNDQTAIKSINNF